MARAPGERAGENEAVEEEDAGHKHQRVAQRADRAVVRVEQAEAEQQRERAARREHEEPESVREPDAVADPRAVVVHLVHAAVALLAMARA